MAFDFKRTAVTILQVFAFILAFSFARGCTSSFHNTVQNNVGTQNNANLQKKYEEMGEVLAFTNIFSGGIEYYCKDTGYVPYKYINAYNSRFSKTLANINKIKNEALNESEQKILEKELHKIALETHTNFNKENGRSKYEYCKYFDDNVEHLIDLGVQDLKKEYPKYFLD